jgi:hypothetical protein
MKRDLHMYKHPGRDVTCAAWHPLHEELFASGSSDGSLHYWLTGHQVGRRAAVDAAPSVAVGASGRVCGSTRQVAASPACWHAAAPGAPPFSRVWTPVPPPHLRHLPPAPPPPQDCQAEVPGAHDAAIWSLAWHPLGHLLATGSGDFVTKFWCRWVVGVGWPGTACCAAGLQGGLQSSPSHAHLNCQIACITELLLHTTPTPHQHHTNTTPTPHQHHANTTPTPHQHHANTAPNTNRMRPGDIFRDRQQKEQEAMERSDVGGASAAAPAPSAPAAAGAARGLLPGPPPMPSAAMSTHTPARPAGIPGIGGSPAPARAAFAHACGVPSKRQACGAPASTPRLPLSGPPLSPLPP